MPPSPGMLIIISGPSGAGKSTLVKRLFELQPGPLVSSVSVTTRRPRPGEVDGVDYYFVSPEEFARRRERGDFLECCQVFGSGDWYGTLRSEVAPSLAAGKWVVLEIDVQGTLAVLRQFPDAVTIFVHPGSMEELQRRLRGRRTESDAEVARRLEAARRELAAAHHYRYQVVNDQLERAAQELCNILVSHKGADP